MSQQQTNSIDIPGLGDPFEDLLIGVSPAVRGADFAMRERPEVIGEDKRTTWGKFSDWIFDGILPDTAPKYYGEGASQSDREAKQRAYAEKHGDREFIDKNAGSSERLAADLLVGFADEGQLPMAKDPSEDVADDILMEMARNTLTDENASPEDHRAAVETVGDRALRQIIQKQTAEGSLADVSNGDDLAKRIVQLWANGSTDKQIGKELKEAGWDYSKADKKVVDRLGQEIEILNAEGEFGKAMGLGMARLNIMKNGGAADVNGTPYDALLDEFIRADASNMTKSDAFSIAGTDAFLSTIRGIGRLTGVGYTTPKDKDILEKMTQVAYEEHPVTSLAGSFAGGFVDPVFFAISMGIAKAPITAIQKGRYVKDLVARGTPLAVAEKMGARATLETIASNQLSKYFLKQGMSLKSAQAAGALVWNTTDAALTNALAEGIVAGGEGASPIEIASRAAKGAGTGILMGVAFDRAAAGLDSMTRALGSRVPQAATKQIDMAISYAAAQGDEGKELSTTLRRFVDSLDESGRKLGRKLTVGEVEQIATAQGVDLGGLAVARTEQLDEIKTRKAEAKEQAKVKREPGQELTELEKEAIERGILKAPEKPLTDAEKQARAEKNNADQDARVVETERIAKELESVPDEELRERYKTAEGAELDAIDMVLAERGALDAEGKKRGVIKDAQNEELTPELRREKSLKADKKLEEQYGPGLDAEEARGRKTPPDSESRPAQEYPERIENREQAIEVFGRMEKNPELLADMVDEPLVLVDIPLRDIGEQNIGVDGEIDPAKIEAARAGDPETAPPIFAMAPDGKDIFVADGNHRVIVARERGDEFIEGYVPQSQLKDRLYVPSRIKEIGKKAQQKAEGTEIIDRTPEGFGPETTKEAPDVEERPERSPRKPADQPESDAPGDRADEGGNAGESVSKRRSADPELDAKNAEYLAKNYEEVETGMDDARVWARKTSDQEKPLTPKELRANRKKIGEVVKKMEAIARAKPSKYKSPSFPKNTKIPVMKPATKPSQVLKDIGKVIGQSGGAKDGMVQVSKGGQSAEFLDSRMVVRLDIGAFGSAEAVNGWAPDGLYEIDKASSTLKKNDFGGLSAPDSEPYFKDISGSVVFEDIDPQSLVAAAKKLKIVTDESDAAAVVFQNPDGSLGFGAMSRDIGSVSIEVADGATPIGMISPEILEKSARIMQRTDNPTVSLQVANMGRDGKPGIKTPSFYKISGRWSEVVVSGFTPGEGPSKQATGYAQEFVSTKPDATSSMSTTGPRSKIVDPNDRQLSLYTATERTTPEGITGYDLETVKGVPGDQMELDIHNANPQSGVDPGITRKIPPKWVTDLPTTRGGKKIVGRIKSDPKGMKYGVRSIAEELGRALDPLLTRQTKEQLSAKNPAHYMPGAHMIRTKSASEPNWMFHEQGHAISAIVRESNPKFIKDFEDDLISLTELPGSFASSASGEEGFAEFIRRLIVSPDMMDQWGPSRRILSAMESANPKIYESVRDAARAFDAYMQRPLDARWRSYMNDTKSTGGRAKRVIANAMTDYVSRGNAPEFAMRRVLVEVRKDAKTMRDGWKAVDKLEKSIKNTAADMMPAYQSLNHIPQMVNVALEGPGPVKPGAPTGMRVHATIVPENLANTSFDRLRGHMDGTPGLRTDPVMLSKLERSLLKKAGFNVPDEPKRHGDIVVLADKSIADAIEPIKKDEWARFETYAQMKATVARIKARAMEGESFPYQTKGEGASPIDLIQSIKKSDKANPHWSGVFKDLEEIMNATLLLDVLSGELKVADAIKLKNRFEHYLPLTRQGEGGPRSIKSGATTAPTANIRRSRGSVNPAEPLLTAMSRKIDEAINAYYWNRFAMSPILLSATLEKMPDVPRSAQVAAKRMGIRLKLDTKKLATASPDEVKKAIHQYIVDEVSQGNELFNMVPEELASFTVDDIGIVDGFDIWRKVPPKAVNVLAPNINGKRQYFQVLDDNLFRIFTEGGETVNSIARISEQAFGSTTQGLKNQITQTFSFTMRNLFRDSMTAVLFGKDPVALVPGFYHAVGAVSMLTNRGADTLVSPELLSRVFREVSTDDFAKQRSKTMEVLAEGLVPRGWRDMNMLSKTLTAPGIAVRVLLKPLELKQILTGQRWLASAMETAPRQGAYIMAKRRGLSDEAAQLAADTVTGNFSERPLSSSAHSIYRTAGFLNPAFQIFNQQARFLMDPVPARGALTAATRMGNIAFWTGVAWALNRLAQGPEDRKRNMERTEKERVTHMDIRGLRIPFDYGIPGGVQSYTWNMLDELDGQRGVSGEQVARKMLTEVFPHTSINPLEFAPMALKAGTEASMGYSLYRGDRLEPSYMDYLEAPDRYFDTTPDLYRWVGRMTESSPIRIQYFARNGLGVQLDDMVKLLDRIDEGFRVDELASLPEIGRMFSREPIGWNSRSVKDAAALADQYDSLRRRAKAMQESGDIDQEALAGVMEIMDKLDPIKNAMLEIQDLYSQAKDSAKGDPQKSKELKRRMVEVARRGLIEMDELDEKGQE